MKYSRSMALITLMFATLLAACSSDGLPVDPGSKSVIMPLKVGNQWIGRWTTFDSTGEAIDVGYDTLMVLRETTIDNEIWYATNNVSALLNRSSGCWSWFGGPALDRPHMFARYPASINDTFGTDVYVGVDESGIVGDSVIGNSIVAATSERVTVPAGTFDCYVYKTQIRSLDGRTIISDTTSNRDDYSCYAPDVGPVKDEYFTAAADGRVYLWRRWELVSMRIN